MNDLTAEAEALRESLGLGAPFHVGIATHKIEDGMATLSAVFGAEWSAIREGAEPGLASPAGPVDWQSRVAHSKQGPLRLELLQGTPGSIWDTDAVAELHHVAFWSYDVGGDAERTTDTSITDAVQGALERRFSEMTGAKPTVTHRWAATVGYTADGLPVLGEIRPGVWATGGYCGTGNLLGAACGRAVARLAIGVATDHLLSS